jgi:FkbM family methyltransferase
LKSATIAAMSKVLPGRIRDSIFHLGFHLAPAKFEEFAFSYGFAPNMKLGLMAMAKRGFAPRTVIDVGAFQGNWSRMIHEIWPASRLVMIEANQLNKSRLSEVAQSLHADLFFELMGAEDGRTVQFNVMGTGSSVLSERSALPRTVETHRLRTLDSLLTDLTGPALLKIDAQGYELEILKGASRVLPAVEAVLLEVSTIEINEGAPLLHDVVPFMKAAGFVVYDILEIHRRPLDKALNQVDMIFVREQSPLLADKRHFA